MLKACLGSALLELPESGRCKRWGTIMSPIVFFISIKILAAINISQLRHYGDNQA